MSPNPHTASAASRSKLPANTDRRPSSTRSAAVSSEKDQPTVARSVCCRSSAVRLPPVSSRNR